MRWVLFLVNRIKVTCTVSVVGYGTQTRGDLKVAFFKAHNYILNLHFYKENCHVLRFYVNTMGSHNICTQ